VKNEEENRDKGVRNKRYRRVIKPGRPENKCSARDERLKQALRYNVTFESVQYV
jgi:hypothetical protein